MIRNLDSQLNEKNTITPNNKSTLQPTDVPSQNSSGNSTPPIDIR